MMSVPMALFRAALSSRSLLMISLALTAPALPGCVESEVMPADAQAAPAPTPSPADTVLALSEPERQALRDSAAAWLAAADSTIFPADWPRGPTPLPGAILPAKRIVAYYGNPLSKRMGILGEIPPDEMLTRLDEEVAAWTRTDPSRPVQPALHLVAVVAQGSAGRDGMYRARMPDSLIEQVSTWAARRNALLFLDVQAGKSTVQKELPTLAEFLRRPEIHLGLDPEFLMKDGSKPGARIGTMDAEDVNFAIDFLADLVEEHNLPPKVLVIHRFTQRMLTDHDAIRLDPRVQVVIHMDGWGPPRLKRDSYRQFVAREPVQFTGLKLFYKNDTRGGTPLMQPEDLLELRPQPLYIQYQ